MGVHSPTSQHLLAAVILLAVACLALLSAGAPVKASAVAAGTATGLSEEEKFALALLALGVGVGVPASSYASYKVIRRRGGPGVKHRRVSWHQTG